MSAILYRGRWVIQCVAGSWASAWNHYHNIPQSFDRTQGYNKKQLRLNGMAFPDLQVNRHQMLATISGLNTKCCVLKLVNMLKSMYTPFWIHYQRVHLRSGCAYEIWMWFEKGNFQSCFTAWCLQIFIWECPQLNAKSTLVEVMAWYRQATIHYLSPCWPRSLLPYDIIRPQWINNTNLSYSVSSNLLSIF